MPSSSSWKHTWAVVLAGGDGTRLQALTRRIAGDSRPKQFCQFFGGKSLLNHTRDRIAPIFQADRTLFALARAHRPFYLDELSGVDPRCLVVQPSNRGTAVAMALCLEEIIARDEDAVVAFFPSDHHYSNRDAFQQSVESGLRLIEDYPDSILILGAEARYPEVEYGWIQPGRTLVASETNPLLRVRRFWEKPSERCADLLHRLHCLWNTFVTIGSAAAFLELLHAVIPQIAAPLNNRAELDAFYDHISPVDFSRAVLSRTPGRLLVLRDAGSGWTDFGSPRRVIEVLTRNHLQPPWSTNPADAADRLEMCSAAPVR